MVEVGAGAEEFSPGQVVACAGNEFAFHAEVNWVPTNLCVAVPDAVDPRFAAFATVGAIAMQGVRQAEAQIGDTACVIGLGLVGQLVVRLLVASGVQVVGLDVVAERCALAEKAGAVLCAAPDEEGLAAVEGALARVSGGLGADRVFLVAGGSSNEPAEVAARAGARPGHGRGHRQVQARPALDRLLREGARSPFLAFLRARALRPAVRGPRRRLSRRVRPLDRTTQPGLLRGPDRPG